MKYFQIVVILLMVNVLIGCATEFNLATQQQETLMYGSNKEVKIGESVDKQVRKQFEIIGDIDLNERVENVFERLVEVSDRKDILYFIKVIDIKEEDREEGEEEIINAFAAPGGYMYVFKDLLDFAETDDELASVIAHELGHITAKHGIKRLQNAYGALALQVLATQASGEVARGTNLALTSLMLEYSQKDEFEADRLGIRYMKEANYDPNAAVTFLKKLREKQQNERIRRFSYWRTHPHLPERISAANIEATGTMEFRDYLNLTGTGEDF